MVAHHGPVFRREGRVRLESAATYPQAITCVLRVLRQKAAHCDKVCCKDACTFEVCVRRQCR